MSAASIIYKSTIPVELLRRSSRLTHKIAHDVKKSDPNKTFSQEDSSHRPVKRKKQRQNNDDHSAPVKKEKSETISRYTNEVSKINCDGKATMITELPEPDGYLEVDLDELDLERTLLGGQSFRWTKGGEIFTGVVHNRVLKLWRTSPDAIAFRIVSKFPDKDQAISETKALLVDYFQLKYKLKALYDQWSNKDQHLAKCCLQYRGFRILRQDPVENVFSFICATNNNIKRISQMLDKLCKRYGNIIESRDSPSIYDTYQSFPPVERLAEEDVFQCLRYELGFGYRAKFINETAKQVLKLSLDQGHTNPRDYLVSLRQLPYKETCKQLMQFQGIGRKVADCICLMSMDHLESVPIDCHIHEIVRKHYMPKLSQERKTLTESVHDLIGAHFRTLHGPLAGWSTSVLFISELRHLKSTDNEEREVKKE